MKKILKISLVAIILLLGTLARFYKIDSPIADWHSSRQADTAAVARNFIKIRFDLLYPQSDSLLPMSEHQLPNPNHYFINEFPFYNALVALIYKVKGIDPIYARVVSIFFSTVGAFFLFFLTKKLFDYKTALLAIFFYEFNPYNIYYGRVIMPDPTFISLSIASLFFCLKWVETRKVGYGLLLMVFWATAILVKPYALFLALPIGYWILVNWGLETFRNLFVYVFFAGAMVPFALWRIHIHQHPEGAFASAWLLNGGNIRFTGAFFRWLIFDRLNRLIFATGGFALFVFGIAKSYQSKKGSFVFAWLVSVLLYMTIFAKGNVNHDYYQIPIVPVGAILVSLGSFWLISLGRNVFIKFFNALLVITFLLISFAFGWYEVRGYYQINHPEIVEAGQEADKILPQNAIVIAPYNGDPAFLYQTNRIGWPLGYSVDDKIKNGATAYISVNFDDETNDLIKRYMVLKKTEKYVIIDLTSPVTKSKGNKP